MTKTTKQHFDEFATKRWSAADKWVWRNSPHGETRYQDAKIRYQVAVAQMAELAATLEEYGGHHGQCIHNRSQYHDGECDCGWWEAGKGHKELLGEGT